MRLNKIQRLLGTVFLATIITGCSPQLTTETYIHEAGETLPEEVTEYAVFKNPEKAAEATLDLSDVVVDKVGTYEATVTLKNNDYPFTVEVVDTTAPIGNFNELVVVCGIDGKVVYEDFKCTDTDISEIKCGLRNPSIIVEEEDLKQIVKNNLEESIANEQEMISLMDMVDVTWNAETDAWEEKGIPYDTVINEFTPEKSGLYKLEKYCVDEYGNASINYVYVLADLEAPIITAVDKEFTVTDDFNEYMNSFNEGISAEDNLLGNMDSYITVVNSEVEEENSSKIKMKISYEVYDLAGNKSEASRNVTAKSKAPVAVGSVYGPKLTQSELDEVDAVVKSFVSNYITPGMTEYQKVKAANDYLCNTVTYAASWANNGANTAWGALIYHEAQCSGYARAMKALCDGMGIGCYYVHADAAASNPSHQWNIVSVDGNWYICDVQGNDDYNNITFLVSDDFYSSTFGMSWDRSSYPACPNNY